jgi:hypothetical protein
VNSVIEEIAAERKRQVEVEGWTPEHDDDHDSGQLAEAASCYANPYYPYQHSTTPVGWPWDDEWWKPKDPRSNLIRAAALIVAEIERIDRVEDQREKVCNLCGKTGADYFVNGQGMVHAECEFERLWGLIREGQSIVGDLQRKLEISEESVARMQRNWPK